MASPSDFVVDSGRALLDAEAARTLAIVDQLAAARATEDFRATAPILGDLLAVVASLINRLGAVEDQLRQQSALIAAPRIRRIIRDDSGEMYSVDELQYPPSAI